MPRPLRLFGNILLYGNILFSFGIWFVAPIYERYERMHHQGSGIPLDDGNSFFLAYFLIYAFAGVLILMKRSKVALYFMCIMTTISVLRTQLVYAHHFTLADLQTIILRYWDVLILLLLRRYYVRPILPSSIAKPEGTSEIKL